MEETELGQNVEATVASKHEGFFDNLTSVGSKDFMTQPEDRSQLKQLHRLACELRFDYEQLANDVATLHRGAQDSNKRLDRLREWLGAQVSSTAMKLSELVTTALHQKLIKQDKLDEARKDHEVCVTKIHELQSSLRKIKFLTSQQHTALMNVVAERKHLQEGLLAFEVKRSETMNRLKELESSEIDLTARCSEVTSKICEQEMESLSLRDRVTQLDDECTEINKKVSELEPLLADIIALREDFKGHTASAAAELQRILNDCDCRAQDIATFQQRVAHLDSECSAAEDLEKALHAEIVSMELRREEGEQALNSMQQKLSAARYLKIEQEALWKASQDEMTQAKILLKAQQHETLQLKKEELEHQNAYTALQDALEKSKICLQQQQAELEAWTSILARCKSLKNLVQLKQEEQSQLDECEAALLERIRTEEASLQHLQTLVLKSHERLHQAQHRKCIAQSARKGLDMTLEAFLKKQAELDVVLQRVAQEKVVMSTMPPQPELPPDDATWREKLLAELAPTLAARQQALQQVQTAYASALENERQKLLDEHAEQLKRQAELMQTERARLSEDLAKELRTLRKSLDETVH